MDVTTCAGMVSYAVKFGTGIGYVIMLSIMVGSLFYDAFSVTRLYSVDDMVINE